MIIIMVDLMKMIVSKRYFISAILLVSFFILSTVQCKHFSRSKTTFDIFIRTYKGDAHWLTFLLRSIKKFVKGYQYIIVNYDANEHNFFETFLPMFDLPIKMSPFHDSPDWKPVMALEKYLKNPGYFAQQYAKIMSFTFSNASYIVHVDSDCIFSRTVTTKDFFDDHGRVYVKRVLYDGIPKYYHLWKEPTERLLGINDSDYETMSRFPIVYPRTLYPQYIKRVEDIHKSSILTVLQNMPNGMFSEFSSMGAFLTKFVPNDWVDMPQDMVDHEMIVQSTFHKGFTPEKVVYYECILQSTYPNGCVLVK